MATTRRATRYARAITRRLERALRPVLRGWRRLTRNPWSPTQSLLDRGVPRAVAGSFVVALLLASASVLLEATVFEWLDVALLYVAPSILTREPSPDVASEILVVTIRPRLFETKFGGQSPIPRAAFRELLEDVVHRFRPEVLAVDYDLSPGCVDLRENTAAPQHGTSADRLGCGPVPRDAAGRDDLDHFLLSSPAKRLVLIRLPVEDPAHCRLRLDWEKAMQDKGVVFAEPDLVHHGLLNAVVKYEDRPESFARRVYCATSPSGAKASECERSAADTERSGTPAATSKDNRCERREQPKERRERKPLHLFNFPGAVKGVRTCHLEHPSSIEQCAAYYARGFRVVFVGANYDPSDTFETPVGQKPGVTLHAYAAYSMKHRLKPLHWLAFLVDVVLGTLFGIYFHKTLDHYATYGPAERLGRALRSVAVLLAACAAIVLCSPWPMAYGWWINPGPMLVGLLVKSWHASVSADGERAPTDGDRSVKAVYGAAWLVVVVTAVIVIISGLGHGSP